MSIIRCPLLLGIRQYPMYSCKQGISSAYSSSSRKRSQDGRRRGVRGISNGKAASHNLVLFMCKPTIQKERSVCKVNLIRLWGKLVHVRRDFKQFDDVADFLGDAGGSVVFQHRVNIGFERRVVHHTAFRRKEGIFRVDDGVCFQKMLTKQGFIDGFPVEPCRPAVRRQGGFLLFQVQAVPPQCYVPD